MKIENNNYLAEFSFVLYFWGFTLLRPIVQNFLDLSTIILLLFATMIVAPLLLYKILTRTIIFDLTLFGILAIFFLFLADALIRPNSYSYLYLYHFIIYGLIPVFIFSQILDIKKTLYYFCYFSCFVFIIYGHDPITGNNIFSGYMDYGFNLTLPAFLGIFIGCHYFKIKWFFFVEIICLLMIIFFSNRSAALAVALFAILYSFKQYPNYRKLIIRFLIPLLVIIVYIYSQMLYLVENLMHYLKVFELPSYSLHQLYNYLLIQDLESFYGGRFSIWNRSLEIINDNVLLGKGIGYYQSLHGTYSHNILLDLLMFFGLFGFIIFIYHIIKSFYKILFSNGIVSILGIVFICLWFPKLLFSNYFLRDLGFWCFLLYPYTKSFTINSKINKHSN